MPKGEPTKVVRLPVWLCDDLQARADALDPPVSLPTYITRRLAGAQPSAQAAIGRCTCKVPTLSKAVSNLCTTCRRLR
jgi:hypothetical protein